jgi:hypothetical protein
MRSILIPAFCTLTFISAAASAQHDMPPVPPPMDHGSPPPAAAASTAPPPMMHGQPQPAPMDHGQPPPPPPMDHSPPPMDHGQPPTQPAAAAATALPPMVHGTPPPMLHGSPGGMGGMAGMGHGMPVDAGPPPPDPIVVAAADPTEQARIRGEYVKRTNSQIRAVVLVNNKTVSAEEQKAVTAHWHDAMFLLRIREVAAADNNKPAVQRCDDALDASDQRFYNRLKQLNSQAPSAATQ